MSSLKAGQIVPLVATLECYQSGTLYVRATIRDKNNAIILQVALDDQGNGSFTNYSYLMPDIPLIKVRYEVFNDPGFTVPSDQFCPDDETYSLLEIEKAQAITTDNLIGFVRGTRIFGKISSEQKSLIGKIENKKLSGVIGSIPRLIGIITDESLSGSLRS